MGHQSALSSLSSCWNTRRHWMCSENIGKQVGHKYSCIDPGSGPRTLAPRKFQRLSYILVRAQHSSCSPWALTRSDEDIFGERHVFRGREGRRGLRHSGSDESGTSGEDKWKLHCKRSVIESNVWGPRPRMSISVEQYWQEVKYCW